MNTNINTLHNKAMDIAEDAFFAIRKGELEEAKRLSAEAFKYERDAALLLLEKFEIEPTRSVLFKSAACLALDAEEYEQAEIMVKYGLQGNPPNEIKYELEELNYELKQITEVTKKTDEYKSDILNIHFNDGVNVGEGRIKFNCFSSIIHHFNELRKAVAGESYKDDLEVVATLPIGSFNLFLKPIEKQQIELFSECNLEQRIRDIIICSSNPNGLKKLNLKEKELNKFKIFLQCIRSNEASINFHFSSVDNNIISYFINDSKAVAILKNIAKLDYNNSIEEDYQGNFIALDLAKKTFKFLVKKSDTLLEGKIDDAVIDEVKKTSFEYFYKITVFKSESKKAGEEKPITKNSLTYISKIPQDNMIF